MFLILVSFFEGNINGLVWPDASSLTDVLGQSTMLCHRRLMAHCSLSYCSSISRSPIPHNVPIWFRHVKYTALAYKDLQSRLSSLLTRHLNLFFTTFSFFVEKSHPINDRFHLGVFWISRINCSYFSDVGHGFHMSKEGWQRSSYLSSYIFINENSFALAA